MSYANKNFSTLRISRGVMKNCYNPYESYGEICVQCGCCFPNPAVRARARLDLWSRRARDAFEFDNFFDGNLPDGTPWREIQAGNKARDLAHAIRKMIHYHRIIEEMKGE